MKFTQKLTPRTILLISVGILAYIAFASYAASQQIEVVDKGVYLQERFLQYESKITLLREQLNGAKEKFAAETQKETAANRQLLQKLQKREAELKEKEEKLATVWQELNRRLEAIKKITISEKASTESSAQANEHIATLTSRLERSKAGLTDSAAKLFAMQAALEQSKKEQAKDSSQIDKRVAQLISRLEQSKFQFAEATAQLSVMEDRVRKADLKAEVMLQYGKEKDRLLAPSEQKVVTLRKQLVEQQKQTEKLANELAEAQEEIKVAHNNNIEQKSRTEQLTGELSKAREEMKITHTDNIERGNQTEQLAGKLTEAQAKIKDAHEENLDLVAQINRLNEANVAQKVEFIRIAEKLNAAYAEQRKKQVIVEEQRGLLAAAQQRFQEVAAEKRQLEGQVATLSSLIAEKASGLKSQKTFLFESAAKIDNLEKKLKRFQLKVEAMLGYGKEKERMLSSSEEKVSTLEKQLVEQQKRAEKLTAELTKAQEKIKRASEKNNDLIAQIKNLKESSAAQKIEIARITKELSVALAEQQKKQVVVEEQRELLAAAQQRFTAVDRERQQLEGQVMQLSGIILEKKSGLKKQKKILVESVDHIDTLEETLKTSQLKIEAMFHYGKEKEQMLASFEKKVASLEKQLVEQQKRTERLTGELTAAQSKIKSLSETGTAQQAELVRITEESNAALAEQQKKQVAVEEQQKLLTAAQQRFTTVDTERQQLDGQVTQLSGLILEKESGLKKQKKLLVEFAARIENLEKTLKKSQLKIDAMLHYGKEKEQMLMPSEHKAVVLRNQLVEQQSQAENLAVELNRAQENITKLNEASTAQQAELARITEESNAAFAEQRKKQAVVEEQQQLLAEAEQRFKKVDTEKQRLENEVAKLSGLIAEKEIGLKSQKTLLVESAARIENLEKTLKTSQLKIEAMLHYGKKKEQMLAPSEQKVVILQNQLNEKQEELATAQQKLEEVEAGGKELVHQIASLVESKSVRERESQTIDQKFEVAKNSVAQLEGELAAAKAALETAESERAVALEKEQGLQQNLLGKDETIAVITSENVKLTAEIIKKKKQHDELVKKQEILTGELETTKNKQSEIAQQLGDERKKSATAAAAIKETNTAVAVAQKKNTSQEKHIAELEFKLTAAGEKKVELEAQIANLLPAQEKVQAAQEQVATLEAELANAQGLQEQLKTTQEKISTLEAKIAELPASTEELATEREKSTMLETQLAESQEAVQQLAVAQEKVTDLEAKLTEAQSRTEQLIATLEGKEVAVRQVQQAQEETAAKMATLEEEVKHLQNLLQEKEVALEEKVKKLAQANKILQKQSVVVANSEELKKDSAQLKTELQNGNKEVEELQKKITELQTEIDRLHRQPPQKSVQQAPPAADTARLEVKVDQPDAEIDSDQDGVVDAKDFCANTEAGTTVDDMGCADSSSFILSGVNFTSGTATLTKKAKTSLKTTATLLKEYAPKQRFEVAGYTDSMGRSQINQRISEQRANTVRNFLISQGVKANFLVSKGYGEENPIADNATRQGRAKNRRVELHQSLSE